MMAAHTPGPWREFMDENGHDIIAEDGTHVAAVETINPGHPEDEAIGNGRLLASAPDLLAALHGFVDEYDTNPETWPADMRTLLRAGLAAIDKAEGTEP